MSSIFTGSSENLSSTHSRSTVECQTDTQVIQSLDILCLLIFSMANYYKCQLFKKKQKNSNFQNMDRLEKSPKEVVSPELQKVFSHFISYFFFYFAKLISISL